MKYDITLKNGVIQTVEIGDEVKNPVGLWIWSLRQVTPQVLTFGDVNILSTEIASIRNGDNHEPVDHEVDEEREW